jgi:hypothetical protein
MAYAPLAGGVAARLFCAKTTNEVPHGKLRASIIQASSLSEAIKSQFRTAGNLT